MALEQALQTHPTKRHLAPDKQLWGCAPFARTWTSSVKLVDDRIRQRDGSRGMYGAAAIAGEGKIGKSTLGIGSGLEAAATLEWDVRYFDAELDDGEFEERKGRYVEAHPACADAELCFKAYHVGRGVTCEELLLLCNDDPSLQPMLIVFDSVNTIAKLMRTRYLEALEGLCLWAMLARRISGGAASFLLIAETNKGGGIKGEQLQYWADLIVRLREPKEKGFVDIDITHSRRTPSGQVGRFQRDTDVMSFRSPYEPRLRVVGRDYNEF